MARNSFLWWDFKSAVYYKLLKPDETVTAERYKHQLLRLNAAKSSAKDLLTGRLQCTIIVHGESNQAWFVGLGNFATSGIFTTSSSIRFSLVPVPPTLTDARFKSFEEIEKCIIDFIDSFDWEEIRHLPERWQKCVDAAEDYFVD